MMQGMKPGRPAAPHPCPTCGGVVVKRALIGPKRRYCSDECRMRRDRSLDPARQPGTRHVVHASRLPPPEPTAPATRCRCEFPVPYRESAGASWITACRMCSRAIR